LAMDCLCQIMLNQKLSLKFEKWSEFQIMLNQNHAKRNHIKRDPPVLRMRI